MLPTHFPGTFWHYNVDCLNCTKHHWNSINYKKYTQATYTQATNIVNVFHAQRENVIPEKMGTLSSRIDVTSRQLIFWEFSTHNSVISATTFIKNGPNFPPPRLFQAPRLSKSRNQVAQLSTTPLFQPPHHSKLENKTFHMIVWK